METGIISKERILNSSFQLADRIILYWYIDTAFLGDESDQYGFVELTEVEYDIASAINRLHKISEVCCSRQVYSV